jgi:glutaredoxin
LSSLNANYKCIEINTLDNGREIQNYLKAKTGQYTVPQIFINKDHVGGCDDLIKEYENGNLRKRL